MIAFCGFFFPRELTAEINLECRYLFAAFCIGVRTSLDLYGMV